MATSGTTTEQDNILRQRTGGLALAPPTKVGFTTIRTTLLRRSWHFQNHLFIPCMPCVAQPVEAAMKHQAGKRSASYDVTPQHTQDQEASNDRDARRHRCNLELVQDRHSNEALTSLTCIYLETITRWIRNAQLRPRGETQVSVDKRVGPTPMHNHWRDCCTPTANHQATTSWQHVVGRERNDY